MPDEIAAVDGGNVLRLQPAPRAGVVPVQEMTTHSRQRTQRRERPLETLDQIDCAEPAEIACGRGRQQVETDVRRGGPCRDRGFGKLLVVVGWKPVVLLRDERLEVAP